MGIRSWDARMPDIAMHTNITPTQIVRFQSIPIRAIMRAIYDDSEQLNPFPGLAPAIGAIQNGDSEPPSSPG